MYRYAFEQRMAYDFCTATFLHGLGHLLVPAYE
jgi:hypothetical protein